jgi:hypothetical protein
VRALETQLTAKTEVRASETVLVSSCVCRDCVRAQALSRAAQERDDAAAALAAARVEADKQLKALTTSYQQSASEQVRVLRCC